MPSSFLTPLVVSPLPDGIRWEVLEPFEYYTNTYGIAKGDIIRVPKGFITDFASIPRLFWSIIGGPTGKYTKSAVIHDYGYHSQRFTRLRTDQMFLEGMKVLGVGWLKRYLMYNAVRLAGWRPWNNYRKKIKVS